MEEVPEIVKSILPTKEELTSKTSKPFFPRHTSPGEDEEGDVEIGGVNNKDWCYGVFRYSPDVPTSSSSSSFQYGFEKGYVDVRRKGEDGEERKVRIRVGKGNRNINGDWVRVVIRNGDEGREEEEGYKEGKEEDEVSFLNTRVHVGVGGKRGGDGSRLLFRLSRKKKNSPTSRFRNFSLSLFSSQFPP